MAGRYAKRPSQKSLVRQRSIRVPALSVGPTASCACHALPLPVRVVGVDRDAHALPSVLHDSTLSRILRDVAEALRKCQLCEYALPGGNAYWFQPDEAAPHVEGPLCEMCVPRRALELEDSTGRTSLPLAFKASLSALADDPLHATVPVPRDPFVLSVAGAGLLF